MFKYLVAVLLLTATIQDDSLFLSPPYPPTAFYQQYYEVIFRVRGLNGPNFTFSNLPNFFTGSEDGGVSGTPNVTGTFKFTISYTDGISSGSNKVVISVAASPNTAASAQQSSDVTYLVIQNAINSWIFRSGSPVSVQLSCNGTAPITWNYQGLPKGLSGDNSGTITGTISDSGLYSFSASAGDARGLKAESYYTLNIQPGTIIKSTYITIQLIMFLMFLIETYRLFTTSVKSKPSRLLLIMQSLRLFPESPMPRPQLRAVNQIRQRLNLLSIWPLLKKTQLR